jgi:hypothetical protein
MTPQWFRALQRERQHCRQRQRVGHYFDCTWQSPWGQQRSRVSSLSPTGCYIEDRFTVPAAGEAVNELTVHLPSGRITVQGTVLEATPGVGFALRFAGIDPDTRGRLSALVEGLQRRIPQH